MIYFEWDENKRSVNLEKHGIDFIDVLDIFEDPYRIELECDRSGEKRIQTIGLLEEHEVVIFLVYTVRGKRKRIISARRASKNERKTYEKDKR